MTYVNKSVSLARQLIRFDTRNPGGNETECIEFLADALKDAGFSITTASFAEGRPSLVARRGLGQRPALCFAGHVDTVPLGNAPWTYDPLGGEIDCGRIYGRGACDMKSGIAAMVTAACNLAPVLPEDEDLVLIIVAGEESGCQGSKYLAERAELLGNAGALIIPEPSSNYPLVGHKGALWLSARFKGRTAHGSMPEKGDNAIYKAVAGISRLQNFTFDVEPHPLLGSPSLNVGYFHGGMNINSVPDYTEVGIDIRTMPGVDHSALIQKVSGCLGSDAEIYPLVDVTPLWTEPDLPWVKDIFNIVEPIIEKKPEPKTVAFFTDGAPLQSAYGGIPTLILGPGASVMAHQTDEFCPVGEIVSATTIYERIIEKWYGLGK